MATSTSRPRSASRSRGWQEARGADHAPSGSSRREGKRPTVLGERPVFFFFFFFLRQVGLHDQVISKGRARCSSAPLAARSGRRPPRSPRLRSRAELNQAVRRIPFRERIDFVQVGESTPPAVSDPGRRRPQGRDDPAPARTPHVPRPGSRLRDQPADAPGRRGRGQAPPPPPPPPGMPRNRPCVVIAGGREPPHFTAYPHHQFIHTVGALRCSTPAAAGSPAPCPWATATRRTNPTRCAGRRRVERGRPRLHGRDHHGREVARRDRALFRGRGSLPPPR